MPRSSLEKQIPHWKHYKASCFLILFGGISSPPNRQIMVFEVTGEQRAFMIYMRGVSFYACYLRAVHFKGKGPFSYHNFVIVLLSVLK